MADTTISQDATKDASMTTVVSTIVRAATKTEWMLMVVITTALVAISVAKMTMGVFMINRDVTKDASVDDQNWAIRKVPLLPHF